MPKPFEVLRNMVEDGRLELAPETDKTVPPPPKLETDLTDEEAFEAAMGDVLPLGWSSTPLRLPAPLQLESEASEEDEGLRELESFLAGRGEMDAFATGEAVEGAWSERGRRYLGRLRRGEYSVQDHLDLHGFGLAWARDAIDGFLKRARERGYTCVRIVHGRGTHSQTEPAILKRAVTKWLSSRRLSRAVIAFASARWKDGGSGAVYVLLYGKFRQD